MANAPSHVQETHISSRETTSLCFLCRINQSSSFFLHLWNVGDTHMCTEPWASPTAGEEINNIDIDLSRMALVFNEEDNVDKLCECKVCSCLKCFFYLWPTSSFITDHILAPWGDEGPDAVFEDQASGSLKLICNHVALKSTHKLNMVAI